MKLDPFVRQVIKDIAKTLDIPMELLKGEYEKDKKRHKKLTVNENLCKKAGRIL